jgi:general secretion pathway protein D
MRRAFRPAMLVTLLLFVSIAVCFNTVCAADIAGRKQAGQRGLINGKMDRDMYGRGVADGVIIKELELKKCKVQDAIRVISEMTGVNIVATNQAGEAVVTIFINNLTAVETVESICRVAGLWYRHNPKTGIVVMTTAEYQRDMVVFRYEPTRMFQLKYLNVGIAARTIADLFGDRVELRGKANSHLGDDYEVGSIVEDEFDDDDDDDDDDDNNSSSSSRTSDSRRSSSRTSKSRTSSGSKKAKTVESDDLTPSQLAMLDELTKRQSQMITENMLSQVSQRTEAPIYVTINRMHNMLFVRTSDEEAMEEIARIIRESDQQIPEVLLEMKVLEVELTDAFKSAFDISYIGGSQETGPDDGHVVNPLNSTASTVGSSLLGMGNYDVIGDSTLVFQVLSDNLRMRLQLLEQNNNIKSLATPMLLAANNHPARLFIGEETVLTTGFESQEVEVSSGTNVTVNTVPVPVTETRSVGSTLTILPSINADRSVVMRIVQESSSVIPNGGQIPLVVNNSVEYASIDTVSTATLEGTVLAQDGMTVAVGGMIRTEKTDNESKVPVLGDIPLLGNLFKKREKGAGKSELVLLITPHVLSAPDQGEAVSRRRLNELIEHPNDLDVYWDSLDKFRAAEEQATAPPSALGALSGSATATGGNELQKSFIEMTKVAVKQVRTPYLLRQPEGSVRPVNLRDMGEVPVFRYKGIVAKPVAAWTNGYHFVTALKIMNRTKKYRKIDVADLNGKWPAATLEQQELAPAGEDGDFTYLYLISNTNFEKVVSGMFRQ